MEKAKQIPYRAIALDLDGTLTNHEKVVTPKCRDYSGFRSPYLRHRTGG